jgi:ribokinase
MADVPARGRVVVVGSANVDLTSTVASLPQAGQTVIARELSRRCGGKGANQAAAAGLLGADVALVAAVGDDDGAAEVREAAAAAGVSTGFLQDLPGAVTGTALITVDDSGENTIVVVAGANAELAPEHLERGLAEVSAGDVVLASLEIPAGTAAAALRIGQDRGATTMLNPSPFSAEVADLLPLVDVVILNEGEAAELEARTQRLPGLSLVVTLGKDGARVHPAGAGPVRTVPAPAVDVVDTTGCGDAFAGAVAAELARGRTLLDATGLAVRYAALAATAAGAQSSYVDRATFEASGLAG